MIKKILFLLIGVLLLVLLIPATLMFFPDSLVNTSVSGLRLRPEHWSGTITIVGDTFFVPWVTLKIEPGTKILFNKNPDILNTPWTSFADAYIKDHNDPTGREGYNQSHFDLTARINAVGTSSSPIMFMSAQTKPEYADWDQIVLYGGSVFNFVEVAYAHNGVYIGTDGSLFDRGKTTIVTNSKIHDSLWSCIDVWTANAMIKNNEIYHCWHQAIGLKGQSAVNIVEENNIHDAQLGINCEDGAKPTFTNNHFEAAPIDPDCPRGEKNQDIGRVADTHGGTYNGKLIYPSNTQE